MADWVQGSCPSFFWTSLEAGGARLALIAEEESLSYARLVERVGRFDEGVRAQLPQALSRPLVLLEAANEIGSIVAYLACLRAGWPVILVAEGQSSPASGIASTYQPNIVVRRDGKDWRASLACAEPVAMHADLAVLLSTSGTTGAEKLVRLSARNLQANATAIASYLSLSPADRAITVLPYHYSYGMSVLHTHLLSQAGLVLSSASLVDAELWSLARQFDVTSLALVPTQFELLDEIAFSKEHLPSLRYVTQAGGKLDPARALKFARQAKTLGFQFFIMYGQTEASPRMSYVPAEDVELWHHSIGRPVDGGTFRLTDGAGREITRNGEPGELVYEGPNVMLGYALSRADLDKPGGPSILWTGDIAERLDNGFYRITGRASRFIKLFGLRIGLDEVESSLRAQGRRVYVSGTDERLVIFSLDAEAEGPLRAEIARRYEWPERCVEVVPLESVPLLASGKVDYRELSRRAASLAVRSADTRSNLAELLSCLLREASLDETKSFLDLGGHSLAYLEVQLFLSQRIGTVPESWECLPLRDLYALEASSNRKKPSWQLVPADLIARDVAILAVIALHSSTWSTGGGSILLLILVGYSLARFQSERLFAGQVGKTLGTMLGRIVVIYYVFIAVAAIKFSPFDPEWFLLVANFSVEPTPYFIGPYWFVSTYVQIIALASLPFALPGVGAKVKAYPFEAGVAATLAVALAIQLSQVGDLFYNVRHHHPVVALELLLAGWCMFFATTTRKKLVATAVILLAWLQNYGLVEANITALMLGGSLCTLWGAAVPLPRSVARGLVLFGSLSLFVYLAHIPVVYGLSRYLEGALLFLAVVGLTFVCALGLRTVSEVITLRGKALASYLAGLHSS